jgi:hypothetical protein
MKTHELHARNLLPMIRDGLQKTESGFSGVQMRWAHRLKAYVPVAVRATAKRIGSRPP